MCGAWSFQPDDVPDGGQELATVVKIGLFHAHCDDDGIPPVGVVPKLNKLGLMKSEN
ncbi:hypothetical protein EMPG_14227 [Blastomyces silverae]|uniref:Uncharacterized protein n=1 Tax=Blastomyces silverae TaxID=2060906 RepID=A0A0H1BFY8_9EURO|nr:hypothetical protein EMPG_14227 [Blastomyces silverae]